MFCRRRDSLLDGFLYILSMYWLIRLVGWVFGHLGRLIMGALIGLGLYHLFNDD